MSDARYDLSSNSNSSIHFETDVLNLLFLCDFFMFFHEYYMLRFDRVTSH